jgi:hypothetical protein
MYSISCHQSNMSIGPETAIDILQSLKQLWPSTARVALDTSVQTGDVVEPKARDVEHFSSAHNGVNGFHLVEMSGLGLMGVAPVNDRVPV